MIDQRYTEKEQLEVQMNRNLLSILVTKSRYTLEAESGKKSKQLDYLLKEIKRLENDNTKIQAQYNILSQEIASLSHSQEFVLNHLPVNWDDAVHKTISGAWPLDNSHPYMGQAEFVGALLEHYESNEEYDKCMLIINVCQEKLLRK